MGGIKISKAAGDFVVTVPVSSAKLKLLVGKKISAAPILKDAMDQLQNQIKIEINAAKKDQIIKALEIHEKHAIDLTNLE